MDLPANASPSCRYEIIEEHWICMPDGQPEPDWDLLSSHVSPEEAQGAWAAAVGSYSCRHRIMLRDRVTGIIVRDERGALPEQSEILEQSK